MNRDGTNSCAELLHSCLRDLALEVKRICEKHEIGYFLIGGSLLGAVRHQGIIPWDDDVDIGLLRADYERFLSICPRELRGEYELISPKNKTKYGQSYAKIAIRGTKFPETDAPEALECGVFIDLFPIDRIPDSKMEQFLHAKAVGSMRAVLRMKCGYAVKKPSARDGFYFLLSRAMSKKAILWAIERAQTRYNSRETKRFANLSSSYPYGREVFPQQALSGKLPKTLFERHLFPIPNDSDRVLTLLYGNYRTLPPEERRVFCHADGEIDFGSYRPKIEGESER